MRIKRSRELVAHFIFYFKLLSMSGLCHSVLLNFTFNLRINHSNNSLYIYFPSLFGAKNVIHDMVTHCGIIIRYKQSNPTQHRSKSIEMANVKGCFPILKKDFWESFSTKRIKRMSKCIYTVYMRKNNATRKTKYP